MVSAEVVVAGAVVVVELGCDVDVVGVAGIVEGVVVDGAASLHAAIAHEATRVPIPRPTRRCLTRREDTRALGST